MRRAPSNGETTPAEADLVSEEYGSSVEFCVVSLGGGKITVELGGSDTRRWS
jgi:hypothetical protein